MVSCPETRHGETRRSIHLEAIMFTKAQVALLTVRAESEACRMRVVVQYELSLLEDVVTSGVCHFKAAKKLHSSGMKRGYIAGDGNECVASIRGWRWIIPGNVARDKHVSVHEALGAKWGRRQG